MALLEVETQGLDIVQLSDWEYVVFSDIPVSRLKLLIRRVS